MPAGEREDQLPAAVTEPRDAIDLFLSGVVRRADLPSNLEEAVLYALLAPGKRIRPLLAWHSCIAAGGAGESSLHACAAVEMIHAFSLVHDDLPALDNDDLRRGRPTLHRKTSEAMAILAGDCLLTLGFQSISSTDLAAPIAALLNREISLATNDMIAGQVFDTLGGLPVGLTARQRLELIHRKKTGALLRASCRMGAICAVGAASEAVAALTAAGERIGLLFQIVDDVLDQTQSTLHLGKTAGKDAAAGKSTYPAVLGLAESHECIKQLAEESVAILSDNASHLRTDARGQGAEALIQLTRFVAGRTR